LRENSIAPIFSSIGAKLTKLRFSIFHDFPAIPYQSFLRSRNDHPELNFQSAITFFLEEVSQIPETGIKRVSYVSSSASMGSKIEKKNVHPRPHLTSQVLKHWNICIHG
jgi:hypothetical protein